MFDDPERYEHDGFYEEDTDMKMNMKRTISDYIADDEDDAEAEEYEKTRRRLAKEQACHWTK